MSVAVDVHNQALEACKNLSVCEHALAKILARVHAEKLHRELGYANVLDYAVQGLKLGASKAEGLLRLGRALHRLPELDRAWAEGRVAWTKAREMLRILTPENEAAWIAHAQTVSSRDLERDVDATRSGEPPPQASDPAKEPVRRRLTFTFDAADAEIVRTVLQWARAQLGDDRDEVGDGEILASLMQRVMHDAPKEIAPTGERFRVVVRQCPDCGRTEGQDAPVTDAQIGQAACDSERIELREGPKQGHLTHAVPPAMRRFVFHRDGGRCRVPGCSSRLYIDLHHVEGRERGHDPATLLSVCTIHHGMIHDGRIVVERSGDGFLFTFPGDRKVWTPREPRGRSGDRTAEVSATA